MVCANCGYSNSGNYSVCENCGNPLQVTKEIRNGGDKNLELPNPTTNWLSRRVQANGVVWLFIAIYQIIVGILLIGVGYGVAMIACGVWNIIQSILDFRFSKQILHCDNVVRAQAIIRSIERSKGVTILFLLLNLAIGGVLGVVGCIFWLALRSKALDRAPEMGVYD